MAEKRSDEKTQFFFIWSEIFRIIRLLIRSITWVYIAYFAYLSIGELAGKDTVLWASLELFKQKHGLPWGLLVIVVIWAILERRLRYRKTKTMEQHIRDLETHIDSGRTSSGLLETGQTHPEDKKLS